MKTGMPPRYEELAKEMRSGAVLSAAQRVLCRQRLFLEHVGVTPGHYLRLSRFDEADWRRYGALLTVAFALAVGRRFRPGDDRAPVIRMVAGVRERYDHTGYDIDPGAAEALVWAALGECVPLPAGRATVATQTLLLVGLLDDEGLSPAELDAFLRSAEDLADPEILATGTEGPDVGKTGVRVGGASDAAGGALPDPVEHREARADPADREAEQEPHPGVRAGRLAESRLAEHLQQQVGAEEGDRRQSGEAPGEIAEAEHLDEVEGSDRELEAEQRHGAAGVDGEGTGHR